MKRFGFLLTPAQIASKLNGTTNFINNIKLDNVAELTEANEHSVCFFENPRFLDSLKNTKAGLVFVPKNFDVNQLKLNVNLLLIENPYIHFMMLVQTWLKLDLPKLKGKIESSAKIAKSASIGKNIILGSNCVLGENVIIGNDTIIESNCVIKDNVKIGGNCHIHPNTTIYEDCILKNNIIIHAGCVIGADGFGYLFHNGIHNKIPQVGNVIIEDDVEVGANSAIDRATLGSTTIGKGTKIDNLVQIGHNCQIDENSVLCAQTGLAGSTIIGKTVYLAGQVGVAGHLKIDDGAMVGAQSGVTNGIPKGAKYFGTPARDAGLQKRIMVSEKYLPEIVKEYKRQQKAKDKK
ncbi:MAG: UDP-3-O-(3-hydroxymyristoyl)glucosamine N-acyltransferase [Candidatus Tenebribacter davisii]|jgi:UDP-3-O-[3-hydroxymyristoyl] glucosamine N-acyltransferase|nr:UDP-3-O-(3-hydroxymyristoyl)glucosamine N-acyltransferase [Candidatus Tenebribacter davisii]